MIQKLEDPATVSIVDLKADAPLAAQVKAAVLPGEQTPNSKQDQSDSEEALSINSILKSSEDSCALLGQVLDTRESKASLEPVKPSKKSKNEPIIDQVDKPISEQHNWAHYKDLLKAKLQKAKKDHSENTLSHFLAKKKQQTENSKLLRSRNYNGQGGLHQAKRNTTTASKPMVDYDSMSIPDLQSRTYKFITSLFQYWCKSKASKYLRIEKFYMNMVLFGLAPSTQYLEKVILNFEEQLHRPVVNAAMKQKPFNRFFVYKVAKDGSLSISHLSLDTLQEIYRVNKYCNALQQLLKRHLTQRYVKQVMWKLAKQGFGLDLKQQARIGKDLQFRTHEYVAEVESLWTCIDTAQNKEISKARLYKFLSEQKILQNADQTKTEEMLKHVMVNWGSSTLNDTKKTKGASDEAEAGKSESSKGESLDKLDAIYKPIFERMFQKAILQQALKNSL